MDLLSAETHAILLQFIQPRPLFLQPAYHVSQRSVYKVLPYDALVTCVTSYVGVF
jgi:hypothetical protein